MLINERSTRHERLLQVANEMMTAARTAPKGKGFDIIEVALVTDETIELLSKAMLEYSQKTGFKFITRDAENILHNAEAIVLIGTAQHVQGLNCGYCGFDTCVAKNEFPDVPCSLNSVDVQNCHWFSLLGSCRSSGRQPGYVLCGTGCAGTGMMPGCSNIYGIPISSSSKNPFFDRISKTPPPTGLPK